MKDPSVSCEGNLEVRKAPFVAPWKKTPAVAKVGSEDAQLHVLEALRVPALRTRC